MAKLSARGRQEVARVWWPWADCQAYDAQVTWNQRMARLLADRTPWYARPVPPAPDHSDPRPDMTPGARYFRELLDQDGRPYRLFRRAIEKASRKRRESDHDRARGAGAR